MAFLSGLGGGGDGTVTIVLIGDAKQLNATLASTMGQLKAVDSAGRTLGTSLSRSLTTAGSKMMTFGRSMTRYVTAPIVGVGVVATKMAADFDQAMANVNSILQVSGKRIDAMSEKVLDLSTKTPQSAEALANGLYNVASSGFKGAEAMEVLKVSARTASAGLTDTDTAAKGIVQALRAYGEGANKAADVSDILFTAVDKGLPPFEDFVSTMGDYVGAAAQLEIPLSDVVGAQAAMTLSGQSAAEAATSLNNVLRSLLKPSDEMTKALKGMGYEGGQAALEAVGLQGIIEQLSDGVGNNKAEWLKLFPEIRAARGAMALAGNEGKNFNTVLSAMEDRLGATDKAFEKQSKGANFQFAIALNKLKRAAIGLGNVIIPILTKDIIPAVLDLVKAFDRLPDSTKETIVKFAALAAVVGPGAILLGGVLKLAGGLGSIFKWLSRIGALPKNPWPKAPPPGVGTPPTGGAPGAPPSGGLGLGMAATVATVGYALGSISGTPLAQDLTDVNNHIETLTANLDGAALNAGTLSREMFVLNGGFAEQGKALRIDGDAFKYAVEHNLTYQDALAATADKSSELGEAVRDRVYQFTQEAMAIDKLNPAIAESTKLTIRQKSALITASRLLDEQRIGLNHVQSENVQAAIAAGDFRLAQKILNRALEQGQDAGRKAGQGSKDAARGHKQGAREAENERNKLIALNDAGHKWAQGSPYTAKVQQQGAEAAKAQIGAALGAAQNFEDTYTATMITNRISRTGGGGATGGIRGAAGGAMVARGPTLLVGEGRYATFAGRGAEAILPLNGRGISILSEALYRAGHRGDTNRSGRVNVTVNINGAGSWDEDRLAIAISRHIGASMRERNIA